ncbi:MAG: hypothetical protein Kow0042_14010 [Calditrichia bacterium]
MIRFGKLMISISLLWGLVIYLGAQNTVVKIVPEQTGPLSIGQNIDIQVRFYDYESLHGYSTVILFNKAVVQLRDPATTQGNIFASTLHLYLPTTYTDSLKVDDAILSASGVVSGSDALAFTIHFQTVGNGCSDIAFILTKLRDGQNEPLPHSTEDGVITVTSPLPDNSHTEAFESFSNPPEITFGNTLAKMDFQYTSGGGTVTIAHYETKPPGGNSAPFSPDPQGLIDNPVVADRYWEVTSSMETVGLNKYSANITFSYLGLPGVENPLFLRVAKRDLSAGPTATWQILDVSQVSVNDVTKEITILGPLNSELFTTGQYTIISDSDDNPLPVELTSFTATVTHDNFVLLRWTTQTEINNYGFFLERRRESEIEYQLIPGSFVLGHGNSAVTQHYSFLDKNVTFGTWHYRLKQVDYNGDYAYVGEVEVRIQKQDQIITSLQLYQNYPNPFNPTTNIRFHLPSNYNGPIKLVIFNNLGEEIKTLIHEKAARQQYHLAWDGTDSKGNLQPSGIYYYTLTGTEFCITKKMVLMR